jgi:hypothetical protein
VTAPQGSAWAFRDARITSRTSKALAQYGEPTRTGGGRTKMLTWNEAVRMADSLAKMEGHCEAIAFSPATWLADFEDAVILKTVGELSIGLLSV